VAEGLRYNLQVQHSTMKEEIPALFQYALTSRGGVPSSIPRHEGASPPLP
jgi:hypothetical protein